MTLTNLQKKAIQDQNLKIDEAVKYYHSERKDFVIIGPAGHGKSYVSRSILERICKPSDKVLIAAFAHQAVGVANAFMGNTNLDFEANTLASAMHCTKVTEGETVRFVPRRKYKIIKGRKIWLKSPLEKADKIVIDECSQISSSHLMMIEQLRKPDSVIIFIGDWCQLPPVERIEGELYSPVFNLKTFELKYPFRYGGELSEVGELFRNQILLGLHGKEFDPLVWKQLIGVRLNHFRMFDDPNMFKDGMLKTFKNEPFDSKYISYTQYSYKKIGSWLRNKITGNYKPFEVGDFVITKSNYYDNKILKLRNGEEHTINRKIGLKLAFIWVKNNLNNWQLYNFEPSGYSSEVNLRMTTAESLGIDLSDIRITELKYWSHDIGDVKYVPTIVREQKRFDKIMDKLKESNSISPYSDFDNNWDAFHQLKDFFCDIQYAYAMTSHTSQGSTYNNSFPSLNDIYSVKPEYLSNLERLQSAYVAITRAKNQVTCIIPS